MTVPILAARDVRKSYGRGANRFDALKGVSIDVDEGESVAIVGKSGSGKSTLMHLLALLDEPTSGAIELSGHDARRLGTKALNRTPLSVERRHERGPDPQNPAGSGL
jgi:putative ABC transport system ATP-binding protein